MYQKTCSRWPGQTNGQLPACSFDEVDEFCSFFTRKFKCCIWEAIDSTVGKVLGFVCGSRPINTAREPFKQLKELPVVGDDTDFSKPWKTDPYSFASPRQDIHDSDQITQISTKGLLGLIAPKKAVLQ